MDQLLNKFISDYTGKPNVGTNSENTGECTGLVFTFLTTVLHAPFFYGNAKDLYDNAPAIYQKFVNTPDAIPQEGDIMVWNKNMGSGFGHTAIVTSANINTFTVFEQNTNIKTPHTNTYPNYTNVIGWLRAPVPATQSQTDLQACLVQHAILVDEANKKDETIKNLNGTINDKNRIITEKSNLVDSLNTQIVEKDGRITNLSAQAQRLINTQKQLQQAENSRDQCLLAQEGQNRTIAGLKGTSYMSVSAQTLAQELLKRIFAKVGVK